jgi:hypothetical protein
VGVRSTGTIELIELRTSCSSWSELTRTWHVETRRAYTLYLSRKKRKERLAHLSKPAMIKEISPTHDFGWFCQPRYLIYLPSNLLFTWQQLIERGKCARSPFGYFVYFHIKPLYSVLLTRCERLVLEAVKWTFQKPLYIFLTLGSFSKILNSSVFASCLNNGGSVFGISGTQSFVGPVLRWHLTRVFICPGISPCLETWSSWILGVCIGR